MYKNYFFLFRCVRELEKLLLGKSIVGIYTQEKDKLFVHIPSGANPDFHIVISVNPQHQYIAVKETLHKAKKNTINFFQQYLPSKIKSIKIAEAERVIKIELSTAMLYVVFRGSKSNVFLSDEFFTIIPFKKTEEHELNLFAAEVEKTNFTDSLSWVPQSLGDEVDLASLKKLPFLGKEILKELELRNDLTKHGVQKIIREITSGPIAVYFDENLGKQSFYPKSFKLASMHEGADVFESYNDALNRYFSLSYTRSKTQSTRSQIEKFLSKEIERWANKLNNLKARIDTGSKEKLYRQYGDLLIANIHSLKKGMKNIGIQDLSAGKEITIPLDEKLSPNQNVDKYYDKSRNEKIEFQKSKELLLNAEKNYERLIGIRNKFEMTDSQIDMEQIRKELKMDGQTPQLEYKKERYSFRHFLIDGRYNVYVGKDSKNNDALTTKFAKQNDFWFHARSVSGSHVVLRVENTKEAIPKSILQKAASIAAFYSKAKSSKIAPVTYTLKKYVVKNQRHEPGQVTVTKENVLLVKPEIPKDCEIVEETE